MTTWSDRALAAIFRAHATVPADAALDERVKIIDAAYPFGDRSNFPYKAWLKARMKYLRPYGYRPRGASAAPFFDCTCGVHSSVPHKDGCPLFVVKVARKA